MFNSKEKNNKFNRKVQIGTSRSTKRKDPSFLKKTQFSLNRLKQRFVARLFWGRTNFYKNFTHAIFILLSLGFAISGYYFWDAESVSGQFDVNSGGLNLSDDYLEQGGSIETVLIQDLSGPPVQTFEHVVKEGETLESIAKEYNVNAETIKWASIDKYSGLLFGNQIQEGWSLKIPEIDGVVHKVTFGDTIDKIVDRYDDNNPEVNAFAVAELNRLDSNQDLEVGNLIFIPGGNVQTTDLDGLDIPQGAFIDPLAHPSCTGYGFSRGFLSYHNGVDLARRGGCKISAVADGFVEYAAWAPAGQGFMVRLKHPGGIKTEYFHGNGEFYVKAGDFVRQGDPIMYMGSTGFSTGTHLHFILWKDGVAVNPRPYVPYIGAY